MHAQTEWLSCAALFQTYHLLHHSIFHSAQQQQWIFSFTSLFLLLCFFSLSCIQLAYKQGRFWQGVNPAGGISPSPTKLFTSGDRVPARVSSSLWWTLGCTLWQKKWPFSGALCVSRWTHTCRQTHSRRHTIANMFALNIWQTCTYCRYSMECI